MANFLTEQYEKLFGVKVTKDQSLENQIRDDVFQLPEKPTQDGSYEIDSSFFQIGTSFDYLVPEDENNLITKYRELALQPEFDRAIQDIVNEVFAYDEDAMPVAVKLDDVKSRKLSESTKQKIQEEFDSILHLLNFRTDSYEIFRNWYIDGRLYYQKIIDPKQKKKGILQLRYIDPRKIRKIRQVIEDKTKNPYIYQDIQTNKKYEDFYIYNPKGINNVNPQGIKIEKDSIAYIHSGLFTRDNKTVISNIHKAIRFFNVLRNIEDSIVIWRLSRSAEKRVFNIELGDMPNNQAESYMKKVIDKFRKKLSFNPTTGEIVEQKRFMTMLEDFWFAKRDGKGTTVDFIQQGPTLGDLEDVNFFKTKFYESLNVPVTRLDSTINFTLGRASEISRDELRFSKFISRLRKRFSFLFEDLLKTQLILKGIMNENEWNEISKEIVFDFLEDNFFSELKWSEIYLSRFSTMRETGVEGQFVSKQWIAENILRMTEEEIEQEKKRMKKESEEEGGDEDDDGFPNQQPQPQQPPQPQNQGQPNPDDDIEESKFEDLVEKYLKA